MSDNTVLREAIRAAHDAIFGDERRPGQAATINANYLAALKEAAESTLPKTKMVEVWHVEYALHSRCPAIYLFNEKETADKQAAFMQKHAAEHGWHCIRVTGPHMQEVPA